MVDHVSVSIISVKSKSSFKIFSALSIPIKDVLILDNIKYQAFNIVASLTDLMFDI